MVKYKGAGYALEVVVAVITVFIFVFGGLNIPENQDWTETRVETSTKDLTYAMQESGYLNHVLKNGETGSMQTAFSTISARETEVSGQVSNLPIGQNRVAFYILPSNRYDQALENVNGGCENDLGEITSRSNTSGGDPEVLRTDNSSLPASLYLNETLYVGDLDPNTVGGNGKTDYDSVWVDNGTDCQFANDEGPYFLDEYIKWNNSNYDIESINSSTITLYNATQPVRVSEKLNNRVNDVKTFIDTDAVNFTEAAGNEYDTLVLREDESLEDASNNIDKIKEFLPSNSILIMANTQSDDYGTDEILTMAGFKYRNVSYKGAYSGTEISGQFSQNKDSQNTQTYFKGLTGNSNFLSIQPPGSISNREPTIQSSNTLLNSNLQSYNFSTWSISDTSMSPNSSSIEGAPDSECYFDSGSERVNALTTNTTKFPDGNNYDYINAELGTSETYCNDNNVRGVKVDTDRDSNFDDEKTVLNGQILKIANRKYSVDTNISSCATGECLDFNFEGEKQIELISHRRSFPELEGGKIAVIGYEQNYENQDLKLISSTIHWLRGDQLSFIGLRQPEGISTSTFSGIQNETFIPYEINMRWSR